MNKIPIRSIASSREGHAFSGSFSIRNVQTLLSGKDMIQELHRHNFYYLLVLERGSGSHSIDFVDHRIGDQSIFFLRPGQVHRLLLKKDSKGFLIEFTTDFYAPTEKDAKQVFSRVSNKTCCLSQARKFNKLLDILSGMLEEYTTKQERYLQVIRSSLDILFIELLRQSRNPKSVSNTGSEYQEDRLDELRELMDLHIIEHKAVGYYARQLHLTPYQLNAITKVTLGKTCSAVINETIILEAKRQLLATSNPINQIARHLGYEDVSYFGRFFKKHTGHSPEAFRHNFK